MQKRDSGRGSGQTQTSCFSSCFSADDFWDPVSVAQKATSRNIMYLSRDSQSTGDGRSKQRKGVQEGAADSSQGWRVRLLRPDSVALHQSKCPSVVEGWRRGKHFCGMIENSPRIARHLLLKSHPPWRVQLEVGYHRETGGHRMHDIPG